MARTIALAIVALTAGVLAGCGSNAIPPETQADKDAANAAAAQWTPEMKEKFKEAMAGHQKTAAGAHKDVSK